MVPPIKAKQVLLKSRPKGWPSEENFEFVEVDLYHPEKGSGDVLVQILWLSVDPYLRGRMGAGMGYINPFEIGKPIESGAVSKVLASDSADFQAGDIVTGGLAHWATHQLVKSGQDGVDDLVKIDPKAGLPLSYYTGILGMPGFTAWVGLVELAQVKKGDTVFVSAAAGAVGSAVGQIAQLKGARAVGSAGSDEKVQVLKSKLKFDDAFNYKTTDNWSKKLKELAPDGVNIYFENVGGKMMEAALDNMVTGGYITVCGMISGYNSPGDPVNNLVTVLVKQLTMRGFLVGFHSSKRPDFLKDMTGWIKEGKIEVLEHHTDGLNNIIQAFIGMMKGENIGKASVKVSEA